MDGWTDGWMDDPLTFLPPLCPSPQVTWSPSAKSTSVKVRLLSWKRSVLQTFDTFWFFSSLLLCCVFLFLGQKQLVKHLLEAHSDPRNVTCFSNIMKQKSRDPQNRVSNRCLMFWMWIHCVLRCGGVADLLFLWSREDLHVGQRRFHQQQVADLAGRTWDPGNHHSLTQLFHYVHAHLIHGRNPQHHRACQRDPLAIV